MSSPRTLTRRRLAMSAASVGLLLGCGDRRTSAQPSGTGGVPARGGARPKSGDGTGGGSGSEGGGGGGGDAGSASTTGAGTGGAPEGELLGIVPFSDDGDTPLETPLNVGWDGRLYTDLKALEPQDLVTPNASFYVRTRYPDLLDPSAPWSLTLDGLVEAPVTLTLADLAPMVADRGVHLLECSGNHRGGSFGMLSAAAWGGVALPDLLALVKRRPAATRVLIDGFDGHSVPSAGGHSIPGASWIFTLAEIDRAFLATTMNGEPLPPDHGAPLRLLVSGWYGCTAIKWVQRITLVDDDAPATGQMREFASRTHQDGVPALARDFRPATIQQSAMPVRVERWQGDDGIFYRVLGVLWGGSVPTRALSIRFGDEPWTPVSVGPVDTNATWTMWSHVWRPASGGVIPIRTRIDDESIPTIRLDSDYYLRTITI